MIKARDRNHPATKYPVSDKNISCPRRLISALSISSMGMIVCGNLDSSAGIGSPSWTSSGEAVASAFLIVGKRKRDQKNRPNRPSSAAQTATELCAVRPIWSPNCAKPTPRSGCDFSNCRLSPQRAVRSSPALAEISRPPVN